MLLLRIPRFRNIVILLLVLVPASSFANRAGVEDAKSVARLYSAAFDRTPGIDGLNFWINSYEAGNSLVDIAGGFYKAPEFTGRYGSLTDRQYVEQLFQNVLGRPGGQKGVNFWTGLLADGTSRASILAGFANAPETAAKTYELFADMRMMNCQWLFGPGQAVSGNTGCLSVPVPEDLPPFYRIIPLRFPHGSGSLSDPTDVNGAGEVTGSASWIGENEEGLIAGDYAWLYSNGASHDISPGGKPRFGYRPRRINEAGDVVGTAWLYSEGSTVNIGLLGDEHTDTDGRRQSWLHVLNEDGQVAGRATRYAGGGGQSVWLYDKGVTKTIGLSDQEHSRWDGARTSGLSSSGSAINGPAMNGAGQVIGYSVRFDSTSESAADDLGRTAWLYSDSTHTRLGLSAAPYTAADGARHSEAKSINQAGQVIGYSSLYIPGAKSSPCFPGAVIVGCDARTAWFYDPTRENTFPLTLSSRADGYEYSDVFHLSQSGVVTGYYMAFSEADDSVMWRMFQFSPERGLTDVVIEGMEAWDDTRPPFLAHDSRHFVGYGRLVGSAENTFFLLAPLRVSEEGGE